MSGICRALGGWQRFNRRRVALQAAAELISSTPLHCCRWAEETEGWTWYTWLSFYIPFFGWIRTYQWRNWYLGERRARQLGTGCMHAS